MCKLVPQAFWERLRWKNHHHHAIPCAKLPKFHIWHGHLWNLSKLRKTRIYRGAFAKLAKLQFIEGPIAKMHLTNVISSSNYPKIIYGMSLFAKMAKTRFEFEFKFKFGFKPEKKLKEKKKKEWPGHLGQPRRSGPNSSASSEKHRSPATSRPA